MTPSIELAYVICQGAGIYLLQSDCCAESLGGEAKQLRCEQLQQSLCEGQLRTSNVGKCGSMVMTEYMSCH